MIKKSVYKIDQLNPLFQAGTVESNDKMQNVALLQW